MAASQSVRRCDVDALLTLVNELHGLPPTRRREHLLQGTCRLVGARVGVFTTYENVRPERPVQVFSSMQIGLDHREQALAAAYFSSITPPDPAEAVLLRPVVKPVRQTFRRQEVLTDGQWYGSEHFNEIRRPLSIDHHLYTARFDVPCHHWVTGMGFHRTRGDRPFSRRERDVIELLHCHLDWMYAQDPLLRSAAAKPVMSPRQRQTLNCLLQGMSEKQVARSLGISHHTVHIYVDAIYKHFGVHSRPELLTLCHLGRLSGD